MNTYALEPSLTHNPIDPYMAMLAYMSFVPSIFLFLDATIQYVDLLVLPLHLVFPTPIEALHVLLDVVVQNFL